MNRATTIAAIRKLAHTFTKALTFEGANSFTGANTFSGQVNFTGTVRGQAPVSPTADYALTASADAGKTFLSTSLCRKFTLPLATAAMAGVQFTFVCATPATIAANEVWVAPASADKLNGGTSGIGLRLQASADAAGDNLTVKCDGSNWWTISRFGLWAASSV